MSLIKKIQDYYKNKQEIPMLFTTPSHNQGKFIIPALRKILGKKFFRCDFSEIDGFDNLRDPKDTLKDTLTKIANIYDSKYSFMLTNGSTSGMLAAMKSVLANNDKVIVARNCHVSVYNGLVITGAKPIWIYPEYDEKWGLYTKINVDTLNKTIELNSDAKAVIVTSPTYEGIFSDIKAISQICKSKDIALIVDEAHGALLNFCNLGQEPAIKLGADISIQSLHKTAGAPNPCALLHISKTSKISAEHVQETLNLLSTTSPSYPLLASIEGTVDYINSNRGKRHIERLIKHIDNFKKSLPKCIEIYNQNNDITKILLRFINIDNLKISELLNKKYNVEEEFSTSQYMLFLTGVGTQENKLKNLNKRLIQLSKSNFNNISIKYNEKLEPNKTILTPSEIYSKETTYIDKNNAIGHICAETIVTYPPGIPLLIPGELISESSLKYIKNEKVKVLREHI